MRGFLLNMCIEFERMTALTILDERYRHESSCLAAIQTNCRSVAALALQCHRAIGAFQAWMHVFSMVEAECERGSTICQRGGAEFAEFGVICGEAGDVCRYREYAGARVKLGMASSAVCIRDCSEVRSANVFGVAGRAARDRRALGWVMRRYRVTSKAGGVRHAIPVPECRSPSCRLDHWDVTNLAALSKDCV
jgi:hypothetical protein